MIVCPGKPDETSARTFDLVVLEDLVEAGSAWKPEENGYAITSQGANRVVDILLRSERSPLEALEGLLRAGCSVGLHKVEDGFQVVVMGGSTTHIGHATDLGNAIQAAKAKVDRTILGSSS